MKVDSKTRFVKLSDIKPYPGNAKLHPADQVAQMVKSMQEYGYKNFLNVDQNNVIVMGHCRFEALKKIYKPDDEIKVIDSSDLSDDQIMKLRILDNKIVSNEYDDAKMQAEMELIYGNLQENVDKIAAELNMSPDEICTPGFQPATEEEQGKLDQKEPTVCPKCGHKWIK